MKYQNWFLFIISLLIFNLHADWNKNGKRYFDEDSSSTGDENSDTTEISPYLMTLKINGDSIFVDDDIYFIGNINSDSIDFYHLGKKISCNDAHEYQKGYIPLALFSGLPLPFIGPIILNNVRWKKVQPVFKNEYNISDDNFDELKSGYNDVYNRKRNLKAAGLGTVGSVLGICMYLYFVIILSEFQNHSQPIE